MVGSVPSKEDRERQRAEKEEKERQSRLSTPSEVNMTELLKRIRDKAVDRLSAARRRFDSLGKIDQLQNKNGNHENNEKGIRLYVNDGEDMAYSEDKDENTMKNQQYQRNQQNESNRREHRKADEHSGVCGATSCDVILRDVLILMKYALIFKSFLLEFFH